MYANVNSPQGFRLVRNAGAREPHRIRRAVLGDRESTLAVGDAYTLDSSNNAVRAAANSTVRGIVEAIDLAPLAADPNGPVSQDYLPATAVGAIIGIEDGTAEFVVQISTIDADEVNAKFNLTDAAADTALAQSRQQLDGGSAGGSQFQVKGLLDSPADNAVGAYAKVICRMLTVL